MSEYGGFRVVIIEVQGWKSLLHQRCCTVYDRLRAAIRQVYGCYHLDVSFGGRVRNLPLLAAPLKELGNIRMTYRQTLIPTSEVPLLP